MYSASLVLLSLLPLAFSAPAPLPDNGGGSGPNSNPICIDAKKYTVTKQSAPHPAAARLVAGEQCAANEAGCTISDAKSYGVTITITAGADLGLDFGPISAGISGSISVGTTTSESLTTGVTCPKFCTCGLAAIPTVLSVEGTQTTYAHNTAGSDSACVQHQSSAPYAADLPVLVPGAAKNNEAVVTYTACRVGGTFCFSDASLPLCPPP